MDSEREVFNPGDATCGKCNQKIAFFKMANGKWCPCNPDGTDHFDDCRLHWFQRVMREGKKFVRKNKEGYIFEGKEILTLVVGKTITGKKYKPDGCDCGLPPWELCKPDCQYAIGAA